MESKGFGLQLCYASCGICNGSPDKALIGFNASYKIADRYVVYGQLMINEFTFKEVFANTGYWANKQGGQLGIKGLILLRLKLIPSN